MTHIQKIARDSFSIEITWIIRFVEVNITNEPALCEGPNCAWIGETMTRSGMGSIVAFLISDADDDNGNDALPPYKIIPTDKSLSSGISRYYYCWARTFCRKINESRFGFGTEQKFLYGGGYCAISKSASAWGINHFWKIVAHEIFHCYGALDEYEISDCTTDELGGYMHGRNYNCRGQEACIMRHAVYEFNRICPWSAIMVGWGGGGPSINQIPQSVCLPTWKYVPFGNLNLGDYVYMTTLDGDWVNDGLRITRRNAFPDYNHPGKYYLDSDGRNFYVNFMAPGIYFYLINGIGDPISTALIEVEGNIISNNFRIEEDHIFKWQTTNIGFTRIEITGGPSPGVKIRPAWDRNVADTKCDFGFLADGNYNLKLFSYRRPGSVSPIYNYSWCTQISYCYRY
ncbi:MAG: zinc-dependent metalloprotease [candidate division Zixibacteria bacterium]|nr:zinc-dependent metalloprotease [candidate division Zixibacteria bacterium]